MKGEDMWESPINVMEIQNSFVSEIKEKTEEMVFSEIKRIEIDVDKEELIKALQYDRGQYEKGYKDGYADAIVEFVERITLPLLTEEGVSRIVDEMKGGAE